MRAWIPSTLICTCTHPYCYNRLLYPLNSPIKDTKIHSSNLIFHNFKKFAFTKMVSDIHWHKALAQTPKYADTCTCAHTETFALEKPAAIACSTSICRHKKTSLHKSSEALSMQMWLLQLEVHSTCCTKPNWYHTVEQSHCRCLRCRTVIIYQIFPQWSDHPSSKGVGRTDRLYCALIICFPARLDSCCKESRSLCIH